MDATEGLERQRQQLMGSGADQMNLSLVKDRISELRTQIATTLQEIRANPSGISFDRVLERFSILNAQYDQVMREVRPQLKYHIAHPLQLDAQLAALVPYQLATKALPEMELKEKEILAPYPTVKDGEAAVTTSLLSLRSKPDAQNAAINRLFDKALGGSIKAGPLHDQSEEQAAIKAASRKLQKAIKTKSDALLGVKGKAFKTASKASSSALPLWLRVIQGGASFEQLAGVP